MFKYPATDFFGVLTRHEVPFVIVGGYAVNIYAPPRGTEDVDIVWLRTTENVDRLTAALQEANAQWISNERDPSTNLERLVRVTRPHVNCEHLMMLLTDYGFVDLFDFVPGMPEEDVNLLFVDATLLNERKYVSLDWLKKMKRAAGRPKDLNDLAQLP